MLFLDVAQLFELLLKLVDTLTSALIMLCDADGLLLLLDPILLFESDLGFVFLLAVLKLFKLRLGPFVLLLSLPYLEFILLELFLKLSDLFFTLPDSRLKLITFLLLRLSEIGGLLLFLGYKLYDLS